MFFGILARPAVFGNGKLMVYINGMLTSSMDVTLPNLDFTTGLQSAVSAGNPVGFIWGAGARNSGYASRVRGRSQSAEVRIWTIARTAEQIRDNMYNVRPDSEGLLGYWKLNDGAGRYVKDYTGNNPDGYIIEVSGAQNAAVILQDTGYNTGYSWDNDDQELTVGKM